MSHDLYLISDCGEFSLTGSPDSWRCERSFMHRLCTTVHAWTRLLGCMLEFSCTSGEVSHGMRQAREGRSWRSRVKLQPRLNMAPDARSRISQSMVSDCAFSEDLPKQSAISENARPD